MRVPTICLRPTGDSVNAVRPIQLRPGDSKTIGRSPKADIVVDMPNLSRIHARVWVTADGVIFVEDLGSMNGIFVNGSPRPSATMVNGDRLRVGQVEFALEAAVRDATDPHMTTTASMRVVDSERAAAANPAVLEALLETSRELMVFVNLQELLDHTLDRLQTILCPDRAAILLIDPTTGELRPRCVRPPGAYANISEFASSTAIAQSLASREVLVAYDARTDSRVQNSPSAVHAGVRSTIVVPLLGRSGPIGALYADRLIKSGEFTPDHAEYAGAFGAHAAAALERGQLYDDKERIFRQTLEAFAKAIDARDHYTAGHSERVTRYTLAMARAVGIAGRDLETIGRAGLLHDIGKVGVPDGVLLKPSPLDPIERAQMESHATIGYEMLEGLPFLAGALPSIRGHHERWDAKGYPDRLCGADIHRDARLMAVGDSFDAMTSARPYRAALPIDEAVRRIRADKGKQFDPEAVDAFESVKDEFDEIRQSRQGDWPLDLYYETAMIQAMVQPGK